jgi:hypothetical protein
MPGSPAPGTSFGRSRVRLQIIKQLSSRKSPRQKMVTILFTKYVRFRERRASHAAQIRDLRWSDGRPGFAGGAGARETFRCPEDQRTTDVVFLHRRAEDGRWNIERASLSGNGCNKTNIAQIRDARFRRTHALRAPAPRNWRCRLSAPPISRDRIHAIHCPAHRPWPSGTPRPVPALWRGSARMDRICAAPG